MANGKNTAYKLFIICIAVCIFMTAVACDNGTTTETPDKELASYCRVSVLTEGGMILPDLTVSVYEDASKQNILWREKADADGKVVFKNAPKEGYVISLEGVPKGYQVQDAYPMKGETTNIVLSTFLDNRLELKNCTFKKGDIMTDFSVTAVDGTVYTLSALLQEKKAVVLNFWFSNCQPCKMEFPYLQEAYETYKKDIALLALNPVDSNTEDIVQFANTLELTIPVVNCDAYWETIMQLPAYPTTVVIDRYGMISFIHSGSIPDTETFERIFAYYTADSYQQKIVYHLDDMAS